MKAEMISISDVFLEGKHMDENVIFLAKEFLKLGIAVTQSLFIRSSAKALKKAIEEAEERADLIVLIGGLGPNEEDITKETVSAYFDKPLVIDRPTEDKIITYHKNSDFVMPDNNQLQALILHDSIPLRNETGLAAGFLYTQGNKSYILLPGPADELQPTYLANTKPVIIEKLLTKEYVENRVLRLFGLSEVQLRQKLESFFNRENAQVHVFADNDELEVLMVVKGEDQEQTAEQADKLKQDIFERVRDYVYAKEETDLVTTVQELLLENDYKITAAESLTGGQFMSVVSGLDGSSELFEGGMVTYSETVKHENLGVRAKTIEKHGVVSSQCAIEMAEKAKDTFQANIGVSLTGVAGPSSLEGEIPGTVWIGIAADDIEPFAKKFHFAYKRDRNRKLSILSALNMVRKVLLGETIEDTVNWSDEKDGEVNEEELQ